MASTLTNLVHHVVFSTKTRLNLIKPQFRGELYSYICGTIKNEKGKMIRIGGMANHIHILAVFHPSITVSDMLRKIKGGSAKWLNDKYNQRFSWQRGYGAFSVSESVVPSVTKYIDNQDRHHAKMTFEEEYLALLRKHKIEFDERYIWD